MSPTHVAHPNSSNGVFGLDGGADVAIKRVIGVRVFALEQRGRAEQTL
jgi:hypothetical protein